MGTGVMIGAGVFALTGQIAQMARGLFPLAFLAGALVASFSAYTYVKMSNAYPSSGGIAMILKKAYGRSFLTGGMALLMYFSMVINQSLVARTFGTYTLQLFGGAGSYFTVSLLGVGLIIAAFLLNLMKNKDIERLSYVMAFLKIIGIALLAVGGLLAAGFSPERLIGTGQGTSLKGFLGGTALALLAFKGFTTITNSGAEIRDPHRNVGRAIIICIAVCLAIYLLVTSAVSMNLTVPEIVSARDYSLAEAARPSFGETGVWITVGFAVAATISGIVVSIFAVSRMLAMLTEMKLVPHRHFGMPGDIQKHTMVYTVVIAIVLTILFDLGRIASMGAIFYIVMDITIHWGVFRHLRGDIGARGPIMITAIILDVIILAALLYVKVLSDPAVILFSLAGIVLILLGERIFLHGKAEQ